MDQMLHWGFTCYQAWDNMNMTPLALFIRPSFTFNTGQFETIQYQRGKFIRFKERILTEIEEARGTRMWKNLLDDILVIWNQLVAQYRVQHRLVNTLKEFVRTAEHAIRLMNEHRIQK